MLGRRDEFSAACLSPFLNTGAIFASVQSFGNSPLSRDFWKMMVMIGARLSAHWLRTWLGILSGPWALWLWIFLRRFSTPFGSILIDSKLSSILFATCGSCVCWSVGVCLVNTDLN